MPVLRLTKVIIEFNTVVLFVENYRLKTNSRCHTLKIF